VSPLERGRDWGRTAPLPPEARWANTDAEAAAIVTDARRRDQMPPPLVLTGGDISRTLGGTGDRPRLERGEGTNVTLDVGVALVDGRLEWFVAHLVARRSWWRGRVLAVCNSAFIGDWNVAPRAHPGDGHLDVVDSRLAFVDRLRARRRLPAGRHLPHPGISSRRVTAMQFQLDPDLDIYLDGRPVGRAGAISVRVEAAAIEVWV
jgi:hypothetical protein